MNKIIKKKSSKKASSSLAFGTNDDADYQALITKNTGTINDETFLCQFTFVAQDKKYPFKLARLMDSGSDLSKRWFVVYYVFDEQKGHLVRKRAEIMGHSLDDRIAKAASTIKLINEQLQKGAIVNPIPLAPKVKLTVEHGFDLYLANCKVTTSKNTYRTYKTHLKKALMCLDGQKLMKAVREDEILEMVDKLSAEGLTNKYRNCVLNTVSSAFGHFVKRKKITENPAHEIGFLATTKRGVRAYTPEQAVLISNYMKDTGQLQLLFFCKCIYFLLARPHEEIRHLKVKNLQAEVVEFNAEHTKGDRKEFVEIPPPLEDLFLYHKIRHYPQDYYIFSYAEKPGPDLLGTVFFYRRYVKVLEALSLKGQGYDLYSWKHTGAIAYWRATRDLEGLMKQCRHKDISQTVGYLADLGQIVTQTKINQFPDF